MKRISMILCALLLAAPSVGWAAAGAAGTVETMGVDMLSSINTVSLTARVYAASPNTRLSFEYGPTQTMGRFASAQSVREGSLQVIGVYVYSLTPNVTYYYRATIEGPTGSVYGDVKSFVMGGGSQIDDSQYAANAPSGNNNGNTSGGSVYPGTNVPQEGVNGGTNTNTNNGTTGSGAASGSAEGTDSGTAGGEDQGTVVTQSGPAGFFQTLFDSITGARPVSLSVSMSPEHPDPRQIVEYTVIMENSSSEATSAGNLSVTLPKTVVYLGDNTGGKMLLSSTGNTQKLTMATDAIRAKEARAVRIMAIATSDVGSASPEIRAELSYRNQKGALVRAGSGAESAAIANTQLTSSVANNSSDENSSGGILPSSFFDWLIFVFVVTGIIVIVRRVMAVYQEKKKRMLEEENAAPKLA